MNILVAVAAGGAIGAVARFLLASRVQNWHAGVLPLGTLSVNLLGSIVLGLCYVFLVERGNADEALRLAIMTGLLGAFTTFSTFSLETVHLLRDGRLALAATYVLMSVLLCVLGAWLGILAARAM